MALGFAYFVADNFSLAMGNVGAYPPIMVCYAPRCSRTSTAGSFLPSTNSRNAPPPVEM